MIDSNFFKKPNINLDPRLNNSNISEDIFSPVNLLDKDLDLDPETLRQELKNNPYKSLVARTDEIIRNAEQIEAKTENSIDIHLADMDNSYATENMPDNIKHAIEQVLGIDTSRPIEITKDQLKCLTVIVQQADEDAKKAKEGLDNADANDNNMDWLEEYIKNMTKKKFKFGLEFLLRLIRLCMAYAVHMIVGGLCNLFMGKINIPIPILGSYPLGTIIASSLLAPVERQMKRALGFPCDEKMELPKFCFDFFTKDREAFNLLPCCIPGGLSAAILKLKEFQEKTQGEEGFSSDIGKLLKQYDIKGSYASGQIKIGDKVVDIEKPDKDELQNKDGTGIKQTIRNFLQNVKKNADKFATDIKSEENKKIDYDLKNVLGNEVQGFSDSFFKCVAQGLAGVEHSEVGKPYQGPPCIDPNNPGAGSTQHQEYARQIIDYVVNKNQKTEPKATNSRNLNSLISSLKRTNAIKMSTSELRDFLKENETMLSPSLRGCLDDILNGKNPLIGGKMAFSKANTVMSDGGKSFFAQLDTNNKPDINFDAKSRLDRDGVDIGDLIGELGDNVPGLSKFTEAMDYMLTGMESLLSETDRYVSSTNKLISFFSSKEFCCVIYVLVIIGNISRGQAVCPTNDVANFFSYANKIQDKKDIQMLKAILAFLKAIIDTIRHSLNIGIEIKGIAFPGKDIMDYVRNSITNIAKLLVDMMTEPIEAGLDTVLMNPSIQATIQNNCFYIGDILSMLKCALEWLKLKIIEIVISSFLPNWKNIDLLKTIRVGGMRLKVLDMLSKLLGTMLNLLLNIGDCYGPNDYIKQIVSTSLEDQYTDAERVFHILNKANITPGHYDRISKTIDGEDPLNIIAGSDESQDNISDFTNEILTPNMITMLRSSVPLSILADTNSNIPKIAGYGDFVSNIEKFTGVSVADILQDLNVLEGLSDSATNPIYEKFAKV